MATTDGEEVCLRPLLAKVRLMRCQYGPLASAALTALLASRATRIDPQPFRLILPQVGPVWPPSRSVSRGRGVVGEERFSS